MLAITGMARTERQDLVPGGKATESWRLKGGC